MATHRSRTESSGFDSKGRYQHVHESTAWSDSGYEHKSGSSFGWGKTLVLAGALVAGGLGLGYMSKSGTHEHHATSSDHQDEGSDVENAPAADRGEAHTENVTHVEERPITFEGEIGEFVIELPNTRTEGEAVTVALILDNAEGFGACPGDEGCKNTLSTVPNAEHSGAVLGSFEIISPTGEQDKRVVTFTVPESVTFNGRTVTIDPDHTRVRVGDGEIVSLGSVHRASHHS